MPFSWYHPDVPPQYTNAGDKSAKMYENEIGERAALLLRLGYSKDEALMRLRGNVAWDFELHKDPGHGAKIEAILDKVFKNRGFGGGGPPELEH